MFILMQLPFADLRPMASGEKGRLLVPDWTADDQGETFVRGFGKVAARNAKGFRLYGERAFADFNNAARLKNTMIYEQQGWPLGVRLELRFRRLYFDGKLAGRFEFGFVSDPDVEETINDYAGKCDFDVSQIAAELQNLPIIIHSLDGTQKEATVGTCGDALGLAYVVATTKQSEIQRFPPGETYGKEVKVGNPLIHVRISNGMSAKVTRDRRTLEGSEGKIFITSAKKSSIRNNIIIQMSDRDLVDESAEERAVRVLFSHMNALMVAQSHFLRVYKEINLGQKSKLEEAVSDMLARFQRLKPNDPDDQNDKEFAAAMKIFAEAFTNRPADLSSKIEAAAADIAKPSMLRAASIAVKDYAQQTFESVLTTVVKTTVETSIKVGR